MAATRMVEGKSYKPLPAKLLRKGFTSVETGAKMSVERLINCREVKTILEKCAKKKGQEVDLAVIKFRKELRDRIHPNALSVMLNKTLVDDILSEIKESVLLFRLRGTGSSFVTDRGRILTLAHTINSLYTVNILSRLR